MTTRISLERESERACSSHFTSMNSLIQGCPNSVLEGRCPAEFSSNPNQTHLKQLIKLLLGILEASMQMCWSKLELNSAGHRPSRTEFGQPCKFDPSESWWSLTVFAWDILNSLIGWISPTLSKHIYRPDSCTESQEEKNKLIALWSLFWYALLLHKLLV